MPQTPTSTIKRIGYRIFGEVEGTDAVSNELSADMHPFELYHPEYSLEELRAIIPQGINSGDVDCEILSAHIRIDEIFENNQARVVDFDLYRAGDDGIGPFGYGEFDKNVKGKVFENGL